MRKTMCTVTLGSMPSGRRFGPVRLAETAWQRTRGLLGRPRLHDGEGLLIARCRSVHTVGMGYAIDVVFIDTRGRIVRVVEALRPMRMAVCLRGASVLELAAGQARALGLLMGIQLAGW